MPLLVQWYAPQVGPKKDAIHVIKILSGIVCITCIDPNGSMIHVSKLLQEGVVRWLLGDWHSPGLTLNTAANLLVKGHHNPYCRGL
jgi:hypothetical protein